MIHTLNGSRRSKIHVKMKKKGNTDYIFKITLVISSSFLLTVILQFSPFSQGIEI